MYHILYIHTHDSGRILSPYGYKVPTPEMESFAKEAAVFRNAYCASPTCSPSRAALLTGTYPHQNGMLGLAQRGFELDCSRHLVQYLNHHDYHTTLCGIQHEAGWYLDLEQGAKKIGYQEELTRENSGYRQEDLVDWDKENALDRLQSQPRQAGLYKEGDRELHLRLPGGGPSHVGGQAPGTPLQSGHGG